MRTNIDIDDRLMAAALKAAGLKTKKATATVEAALRLLVQTRAQGRIRALRGKLHWEGSLDGMRRDRRSPRNSCNPPGTSTDQSEARLSHVRIVSS